MTVSRTYNEKSRVSSIIGARKQDIHMLMWINKMELIP